MEDLRLNSPKIWNVMAAHLVGLMVIVILALTPSRVQALDCTVNPGDSIQDCVLEVCAADEGGTVFIKAGVYTEGVYAGYDGGMSPGFIPPGPLCNDLSIVGDGEGVTILQAEQCHTPEQGGCSAPFVALGNPFVPTGTFGSTTVTGITVQCVENCPSVGIGPFGHSQGHIFSNSTEDFVISLRAGGDNLLIEENVINGPGIGAEGIGVRWPLFAPFINTGPFLNAVIQNNIISNTGTGIQLNTNIGSQIHHNQITNTAMDGIRVFNGSSQVEVFQNHLTGIGGDGLETAASSDILWQDNIVGMTEAFSGPNHDGFRLFGNPSDVVYRRNTVTNAHRGANLEKSSGVIIDNNTFINNTSHGVELGSGANSWVVQHNKFQNYPVYGALIQHATDGQFNHNHFCGESSEVGIQFEEEEGNNPSNIQVQANVFSGVDKGIDQDVYIDLDGIDPEINNIVIGQNPTNNGKCDFSETGSNGVAKVLAGQ